MASGQVPKFDHFNRSSSFEIASDETIFSLDCDASEDCRLINFHQVEHYSGTTFRWSEPVSMIRIGTPPINCRVEIDTACLRGESVDFPFQIHWNDYLVPRKAIQISQGVISFSVAARMCEPTGEQRLTISSKPLNAENGRRKLGMPIRWIQVRSQPNPNIHSFEAYLKKTDQKKKNSVVAKFLGKNEQEPVIPIWQVRFPELSVPPNSFKTTHRKVENYPVCDRVVVSACEINARHGTGLLIQYLFDNFDDLATVNSYHCYNGDRVSSLVHHRLDEHDKMQRHEIYDQVFDWFGHAPPREAYVVPYFKSDFMIAMALKDLFQTKICLHVMDDNCLYGDISHQITQEAINKTDLLFVISPEMRQQYEQSFGRKAYVLPPIVPARYIPDGVVQSRSVSGQMGRQPSGSREGLWNRVKKIFSRKPVAAQADRQRGILIGNIWDNAWLELLRKTIRESGLQVDWYSNNPNAVWLQGSQEQLAKDGIHLHGSLWGEDLIEELRQRPFAIMPSGLLSGEGCKEAIARLSLPSRIPFVIATAHLPVIVLGSPQTSVAKFVSRFDLGITVEYEGAQLKEAVNRMLDPVQQVQFRQRAHQIARHFSADSMQQWLWQSLQQRVPADDRFESLFCSQQGDCSWFFDESPPEQVHWSFRETWKMLERVKRQGFRPDVIIDVGSSSGNWSWTAASLFPDARYVMVDPMMSRYNPAEREQYLRDIKSYDLVEAALSDRCGQADMLVSHDLYGSSLLKVDQETRSPEVAQVNVLTLDELVRQRHIQGRTLLKIDVQFAEHAVINGGLDFLRNSVDVLILELTIQRQHPAAKTYREMLEMMEQLGYQMVDEIEGWRNPRTGLLEQKDTVFIRKERVQQIKGFQLQAA